MPTRERKEYHAARLVELCNKYTKCFIVNADNVGSKQLGDIRAALRNGMGNKDAEAVVYMGKNTLIRRTLNMMENKMFLNLIPEVRLNIGFVFTNGSLPEIKKIIGQFNVGAPAKVGNVAYCQILAEAGPTGQPPDKTGFFQALNIPTKINRGQIEIVAQYIVCDIGDVVGASQAALLGMLDIKPFEYGLKINKIFDNGSVFDPAVLDITEESLLYGFAMGCRKVAALSYAVDYPTLTQVPHEIVNGFKDLVAVAWECDDYTFANADLCKDMVENPGKYGG